LCWIPWQSPLGFYEGPLHTRAKSRYHGIVRVPVSHPNAVPIVEGSWIWHGLLEFAWHLPLGCGFNANFGNSETLFIVFHVDIYVDFSSW
jgi:hypothetical protein